MRGRVLAVLLLALAPACGGSKDAYPPEVVDNFMHGCTARSEPRTCRCALDALQSRFTVDEFRGLESRAGQGDVPKEMVDATAGCR